MDRAEVHSLDIYIYIHESLEVFADCNRRAPVKPLCDASGSSREFAGQQCLLRLIAREHKVLVSLVIHFK